MAKRTPKSATERLSKADLVRLVERLQREQHVLSVALQETIRGTVPDAIETVKYETGRHDVYRLFRAKAAHGGILMITSYDDPNDTEPYTSAHYLEWYSVPAVPEELPARCAIERMRNKARNLARASVGLPVRA
jgi:hypothetical protein